MAAAVFHTELNRFCQKYLVVRDGEAPPALADVVTDQQHVLSMLFEQMLLFDSVSLKVVGENIPLMVLLNVLGPKGVESLVEQGALKFVLWDQLVLHNTTDHPGLDPLQFGQYSSDVHSDPEKSIALGFRWLSKPIKRGLRRHLIRKVRDVYSSPSETLSKEAASLVRSAYFSGKLKEVYGLGIETGDYTDLPLSHRALLGRCADELMEYCHLVDARMTTYDKLEFYSMFVNSEAKILSGEKWHKGVAELSELHGMPDLKSLYLELDDPFKELLAIRGKRNARKFRAWLMQAAPGDDSESIGREYIEAIANSKGFLETKTGRFFKSVAMAAIGAVAGSVVAGPVGGVIGAPMSKVVEPAVDLGLDLIDELLIAGLTKGWSPKMFFDDLERLRSMGAEKKE